MRIWLMIIPLSGLLWAVSCNGYTNGKQETVIARVGEKQLLQTDLPTLPQASIEDGDSLRLMDAYIEKWIKNELMLRKAELNLTDEYKQNVERRLNDTRTSLMIYQYKQQMISQKMDTLVSEQKIKEYYEENINNFRLKYNIVKALYLKIPSEAPNLNRVRNWYRSDKSGDLAQLEGYCYQFADKYDDFREGWIEFDRLLSMLPVEADNQDYFLRRNRFIEEQDSAFHYYVSLRDYILHDNPAPMEYVQDEIKDIILNNRKLSFLQKLENSIYNDALDQGAFKVY
jgi:hypothetical protein